MTCDECLDTVQKYLNELSDIDKKKQRKPTDPFVRYLTHAQFACHQIMEDLMLENPYDDAEIIVEKKFLKFYHLELKALKGSVQREIFRDARYTAMRLLYRMNYDDFWDEECIRIEEEEYYDEQK